MQCLQRLHGGREPWVRHGGTLFALFRLRDKDLLSDGEYARLASAYQFLRNLEHRLQFDEDRQTHTLPTDPRSAGAAGAQDAAETSGAMLTRRVAASGELDEHLEEVREIYERVIHAQKPMYYAATRRAEPVPAAKPSERAGPRQQPDAFPGSARAAAGRPLAQAPICAAAATRFEHFLEKVSPSRSCWRAREDPRLLAASSICSSTASTSPTS